MCPGILPATGWMAQVTFPPPSASSPSAISRSACRVCATAMPQPGTMMTETAFSLDHTATPPTTQIGGLSYLSSGCYRTHDPSDPSPCSADPESESHPDRPRTGWAWDKIPGSVPRARGVLDRPDSPTLSAHRAGRSRGGRVRSRGSRCGSGRGPWSSRARPWPWPRRAGGAREGRGRHGPSRGRCGGRCRTPRGAGRFYCVHRVYTIPAQ